MTAPADVVIRGTAVAARTEVHDAGGGLSQVRLHFTLDDGRTVEWQSHLMPAGAVVPWLEELVGDVALYRNVWLTA